MKDSLCCCSRWSPRAEVGMNTPADKLSRILSILLERATQFRCSFLESNNGRVTTTAVAEEANIEDILTPIAVDLFPH